jgi:hypothetical protein
MNFEKASSLYRNDKTLQLLRADNFPLLMSFFHLAFKQQNKISFTQTEIRGLLGDYLFSLERKGISDYKTDPLSYLLQWADQGYVSRRYYDSSDEPVYELTPASENALKWLDDLTERDFVGANSQLRQLFMLLKQLVNSTASQDDRVKKLESDLKKLEVEIKQTRKGIYERPDDTRIKEDYYLAEETAKRLLSDFKQVEQNFRDLDKETRHAIIKSDLPKGKLLEDIFDKQDYLWNTDQGKSFSAFWEFLMSESMQRELEELIEKINEIPIIRKIRQDPVIDRIKTNLVDAGDKVNRTNGSLIEQLRKYVEQKSLLDSKRLLKNIEQTEIMLMDIRNILDSNDILMDIDSVVKPTFIMGRSLFRPPVKVTFEGQAIQAGVTDENYAEALFNQFHIDLDELSNNIKVLLRQRPQVTLQDVLQIYSPTKGMAELIGYVYIASKDSRHLFYDNTIEEHFIENKETGNSFSVHAPRIIYNR